jgi:uncharacterized phage protein gp47/JayE
MPWERPTLREINTRIQSDLAANLDGIGALLRRSILKVQGKVYAGVAHEEYGAIQNYKDNLLISTADEEWLDKHGTEFGLPRNRGSKSTGSVIATGTTGLIIDKGSRLQSASGNIYIIDDAVVLVGGTVNVVITAENVGEEYNEDAGTILSFVSPVSGINSTVTVDGNALTNGTDIEEVEAYRTRLLNRKRAAPHGGTDFDYINWALEYGVVTRSWVIEHYQGVGTIGLAFVMDNDEETIIPSAAEMTAVKNYIIYHNDPNTNLETGMPVTAKSGLFMIPLQFRTVNMTIKLYPNTATIQANVRERLVDLFRAYGGPQKIIALSQMNEAISSAAGEIMHKITIPIDDEVGAVNEVHLLGDITFQDYN